MYVIGMGPGLKSNRSKANRRKMDRRIVYQTNHKWTQSPSRKSMNGMNGQKRKQTTNSTSKRMIDSEDRSRRRDRSPVWGCRRPVGPASGRPHRDVSSPSFCFGWGGSRGKYVPFLFVLAWLRGGGKTTTPKRLLGRRRLRPSVAACGGTHLESKYPNAHGRRHVRSDPDPRPSPHLPAGAVCGGVCSGEFSPHFLCWLCGGPGLESVRFRCVSKPEASASCGQAEQRVISVLVPILTLVGYLRRRHSIQQ